MPKLWTVEQTLAFYRTFPNVAYAEPNYVANQHGHGWSVYPVFVTVM